MSIEDRSLDASKEEGTATVIDGSDDELSKRGPFRLYSEGAKGYLHIDGNGSLRADGKISDHDTKFKLHITGTEDPIVILEHYKPKVVAIDATDKVITKDPPPETLEKGTLEKSDLNIRTLKQNHSDILFYKRQREGGNLFYLESCKRDKQRVLGFDADGVKYVEPGALESLLHGIECPNT